MFPERLPQSWIQVSHGAQGLAYHWWRVFHDEPVLLVEKAIAVALGLQPDVRRCVGKWLKELVEAGALEAVEGGELRMKSPLQKRTKGAATASTGRALVEHCSDTGRALVEHWIEPKPAEPQYFDPRTYTDNTDNTDGIDTRARVGAAGKPDSQRLSPYLRDAVRAEFMRTEIPSQAAGNAQWQDGCIRVQDALDLKHFPDASAACHALAKAAVAACAKKGGKLGFALQQVTFTPTRKPPVPAGQRRTDIAEDV